MKKVLCIRLESAMECCSTAISINIDERGNIQTMQALVYSGEQLIGAILSPSDTLISLVELRLHSPHLFWLFSRNFNQAYLSEVAKGAWLSDNGTCVRTNRTLSEERSSISIVTTFQSVNKSIQSPLSTCHRHLSEMHWWIGKMHSRNNSVKERKCVPKTKHSWGGLLRWPF